MMQRISPTKPQFDYMLTNEPFPALVAGFGAGKTEAAVNRAIIGKLRHPEVNGAFMLRPTI
jgi:hypothetical protein